MRWIMVDVEADGPIPGDYSMVSFGAIVVEPGLERTFYAKLRPISDRWVPEALAVSGFSREETLEFPEPVHVMRQFAVWLRTLGPTEPRFVSDNGFDWQFMNWYFHHFTGKNPFGYYSSNLSSLYNGMMRDPKASFRHLRRTRHSHHALDDARGNAEALLTMKQRMGFEMQF